MMLLAFLVSRPSAMINVVRASTGRGAIYPDGDDFSYIGVRESLARIESVVIDVETLILRAANANVNDENLSKRAWFDAVWKEVLALTVFPRLQRLVLAFHGQAVGDADNAALPALRTSAYARKYLSTASDRRAAAKFFVSYVIFQAPLLTFIGPSTIEVVIHRPPAEPVVISVTGGRRLMRSPRDLGIVPNDARWHAAATPAATVVAWWAVEAGLRRDVPTVVANATDHVFVDLLLASAMLLEVMSPTPSAPLIVTSATYGGVYDGAPVMVPEYIMVSAVCYLLSHTFRTPLASVVDSPAAAVVALVLTAALTLRRELTPPSWPLSPHELDNVKRVDALIALCKDRPFVRPALRITRDETTHRFSVECPEQPPLARWFTEHLNILPQ